MRSLVVCSLLVAMIIGCATTRPEPADPGDATLALVTTGVSMLAGIKVKENQIAVSISGKVVLSEKCRLQEKTFAIEIYRRNTDDLIFKSEIIPEGFLIEGVVKPDEYYVFLINSRTQKILHRRRVLANFQHDRFYFNFIGCP